MEKRGREVEKERKKAMTNGVAGKEGMRLDGKFWILNSSAALKRTEHEVGLCIMFTGILSADTHT